MEFKKIVAVIFLTLAFAMPTMAAEKEKLSENSNVTKGIVQDAKDNKETKSTELNAEDSKQSSGIVLEPVVVTATRTETSAFKAPASIVVLDDEDITREQASTLGDVLEGIPNVDFGSGTTPYFQVPSIRGLSDEQTIIKVDGAKQQYNDNGGNAKAPVIIDPVLLKQVEVLRGPSSTLHGSGGIGGVISMRTKDASDFLKPGESLGATVKTGYQSVDAQKHATVISYARYNDLGFVASATNRGFGHLQTSDPSGETPFIARTGYSQTQFLKTSYTPGNQYISLSYQNSNDRYSFSSGRWFESQQNQTTLNYDVTDGDWLDLKLSAQYTWRRNESKGASSLSDTFSAWSGDVQNTVKFGPTGLFRNAVTFGVDYQANHQEGTRAGNDDPSRPKVLSTDYGMFIQDEIKIPAGITLIPAIRYTHYTRTPKDLDFATHDEGRFTPKFTVEYQPTDWLKLFGTYAESFRPPSASEMYLYMPWPGWGAVVPNTSLKPETGRTYEFGTSLGFDKLFTDNDPLRLKFVYFRETIEDFMEPGPVLGTPPNASTSTINAGKVKRYGFEAEMSYAYKDLFAAVSYGKVMGRDEDGDICGATPEQINVKLNWDIPQYDLDLTWKSQFTGESKDYNPADGDSETVDSYHTHGIGLAWIPQDILGYDGLRVDMGLDNIFDTKYRTYRGGLEKGRNFKVTLSFEF